MSKIVLTDAATPSDIAAGKTQLYTKSGGGPGTDGLYYKQGSTEVGPLIVGGTVNNLQDAYDGGNTILVDGSNSVSISSTAVGGPDALTVTVGGSTNASGVVVTHSGPGASPAIEAEIVNPASTGNVVSSISNGSGSALYAETKGLGNGVTVYADPGSAGRGIVSFMEGTGPAVYAEKSNTGNGIEVKMISPATGSGLKVDSFTAGATSPGVDIAHAGEAVGVLATMTNAVNATGFSTVVSGATAFSAGMRIELTNPAAAGVGLRVTMPNTATGNAIEVQDTTPATVFAVDVAGNTTTPSVVFGGSRITVEGDSAVSNEPINPRLSLTSGSVAVGALTRTYFYTRAANAAVDLETDAVATARQPTTIEFTGAGGVQIELLSSKRYPEGTELFVLNSAGAALTVGVAPPTTEQDLVKVDRSPDGPLAVPAGTGARFLSRGSDGWTKTGTF